MFSIYFIIKKSEISSHSNIFYYFIFRIECYKKLFSNLNLCNVLLRP